MFSGLMVGTAGFGMVVEAADETGGAPENALLAIESNGAVGELIAMAIVDKGAVVVTALVEG